MPIPADLEENTKRVPVGSLQHKVASEQVNFILSHLRWVKNFLQTFVWVLSV